MKNNITEIKKKKTPEGINSRLNDSKEWFSEPEDRVMQITAAEQKEKRMKRNKDHLRDLWDNIKYTAICIYRGSRRTRVRVRKYLSRNRESHTRWTQMTKIKDEGRILKAGREKQQIANKGTPIKLSADFSAETLQAINAWHGIFKVIKGKNLQPRIPYPTRLLFRFWWRNQKLYRQTKSKRIQHPTRFTINANGNSPDEKEKARTRNKTITKWEKLTGKGKHIVKVGDHLHMKLVGRLKDKSGKITCIYNKQLRDTQNN